MSQETAISWTDLSWNPVHGCSRVSTGCLHCYAETLSLRYGQTPAPWTQRNAALNVTLKPHKLREPLSGARAWQGLGAAAAAAGKTDGKLVFVNSMSDLFHEQIPDEYIAQVFAVMALAERHTFQVLTKRPERMREVLTCPVFWSLVAHEIEEAAPDALDGASRRAVERAGAVWLRNVWLGVSIENRKWVGRADVLRATPAAVRFISAEPLLGPLIRDGYAPELGASEPLWADRYRGPELDLTGIDWLIVGGESGKGHRPMQLDWARDLRDAAQATRIGDERRDCAFFFKQSSGPRAGTGRILDGRTWNEYPQARQPLRAAA